MNAFENVFDFFCDSVISKLPQFAENDVAVVLYYLIAIVALEAGVPVLFLFWKESLVEGDSTVTTMLWAITLAFLSIVQYTALVVWVTGFMMAVPMAMFAIPYFRIVRFFFFYDDLEKRQSTSLFLARLTGLGLLQYAVYLHFREVSEANPTILPFAVIIQFMEDIPQMYEEVLYDRFYGLCSILLWGSRLVLFYFVLLLGVHWADWNYTRRRLAKTTT